MEVDFNGENDKGRRQYIDPVEVNEKVKDFLGYLKDSLDRVMSQVKDELVPTVKDWMANITDSLTIKMVEFDEEYLTFDRLVEIVKENKVTGSDVCLVAKQMEKDGSFLIIATFLKDGKLKEPQDNLYIVIECEGISKDVKDKFGKSEIIILK